MLTLTRRGWGVALSAFAVWASWWLIGLRDLWYLAGFLAFLVLLGLAITAAAPLLTHVDVRVSVADPTPTAGETVRATAHVRQHSHFGFQLALRWPLPEPGLTTPVAREESTHTAVRLTLRQRGRHEVGVTAIEFLGPLGLARLRLARRTTVELLVLPRLIPALEALIGGGGVAILGEDDSALVSSIHSSGIPGGAVREYQAGDTRRQIHWKQSARQGELLVNIHEHTDQQRRTFLLVTGREAYAHPEEFERAVSAIASLAASSLGEGTLVRLQLGRELRTLSTTGEALRELALLDADDAVPEPVPDGRVHAVVTGAVTAHVEAVLAQLPPSMLIITAREPPLSVAPGWRRVVVNGG